MTVAAAQSRSTTVGSLPRRRPDRAPTEPGRAGEHEHRPGHGRRDRVTGRRFLYVQTGRNGIVDEFSVGSNGALTLIGSVTVPGGAGGKASLPADRLRLWRPRLAIRETGTPALCDKCANVLDRLTSSSRGSLFPEGCVDGVVSMESHAPSGRSPADGDPRRAPYGKLGS